MDEFSDVKVFRLYGPLYSGSAERFVSKVRRSIEAREEAYAAGQRPSLEQITSIASPTPESLEMYDMSYTGLRERSPSDGTVKDVQTASLLNDKRASVSILPLRGLVIDCSAMNFVDIVGAEAMKNIAKECHKKKIKIVLAVCSGESVGSNWI